MVSISIAARRINAIVRPHIQHDSAPQPMKSTRSWILSVFLLMAWMACSAGAPTSEEIERHTLSSNNRLASNSKDSEARAVPNLFSVGEGLSGEVIHRDEDGPIIQSLTKFSQSPWFALTSGLASILGLLLPLYATQVKPLPFSLYRSLMWRKQLSIAAGVGIAVFAGVSLNNQDGALRRVHELVLFSGGKNVYGFSYPSGYFLTLFWLFLIVFGIYRYVQGVSFDPVAEARNIIIREQGVIEEARAEQVASFLSGRNVDQLTHLDRRSLREIMDYYRYVQWRYADVVLGAPPPTFPMFRNDVQPNEDND
jgi:hypothetical protein